MGSAHEKNRNSARNSIQKYRYFCSAFQCEHTTTDGGQRLLSTPHLVRIEGRYYKSREKNVNTPREEMMNFLRCQNDVTGHDSWALTISEKLRKRGAGPRSPTGVSVERGSRSCHVSSRSREEMRKRSAKQCRIDQNSKRNPGEFEWAGNCTGRFTGEPSNSMKTLALPKVRLSRLRSGLFRLLRSGVTGSAAQQAGGQIFRKWTP